MDRKKLNKATRRILLIASVLIFLVVCWEVYVHLDYDAENVEEYLLGEDGLLVSEIEEGWFFDGPGEEALIFYPGAKVDPMAYAPLMSAFAQDGIDCFLVKMHDNLAFFGVNKAADIMEKYNAEKWYLSGHSLGGAMAAKFAREHADSLEGLILFGAYTTSDLSNTDLSVYTIYGSNDLVVNREKLKVQTSLLPKVHGELEIQGGNHAGFAFYGPQKGDGEAEISKEQQIGTAVSYVMYALGKVE